jgi:methylglutaconyl-CoA hydratase
MTYSHILLEHDGPIATVTLDRPRHHNAFDETLVDELTHAYATLSQEQGVRAVVLKGSGKSFCAGADLEWMARMASFSREQNLEEARRMQRMFAAIADCPKVTLASVQGPAMGGGAGLVAACDVAVADHAAVFGFTEARLGLAPAVIAPYVIRKIGMGAARALFVTGETFSADRACEIGLVQEVEGFSVDTAVRRKLEAILQTGPGAIGAIKRLLAEIGEQPAAQVSEVTVACIADLRVSEEGQEGIRAFLEKRKPRHAL